MSLHKLKKYAKDYNINVANVLEKDELINKLMAMRVRITSSVQTRLC